MIQEPKHYAVLLKTSAFSQWETSLVQLPSFASGNLSTYAVLLYENCQPSRACCYSVKMSGGAVLGFLRTMGVSGFVFLLL